MNLEDKDRLLEFFSRDLNEKEKLEFIEKAGSDKEFLKELVKMTELNEVFEDRYGLSRIEENNRSSSMTTRKISIILGLTAVLAFGLFLGIQRFQFDNNPGKYLFEKIYEPFDISLTRSSDHLSAAQDNSLTYIQLYSLYVQGEYEIIIDADIDSLKTDEIQESAYVLLGISAIEVGKYDKAKNSFLKVNSESHYASIANWYLLLLRVYDNQFENIIPELDQFISNNLLFMEKAENLKEQIIEKGLVN
jgi:tetratricopeptide (TPR) repeat protein